MGRVAEVKLGDAYNATTLSKPLLFSFLLLFSPFFFFFKVKELKNGLEGKNKTWKYHAQLLFSNVNICSARKQSWRNPGFTCTALSKFLLLCCMHHLSISAKHLKGAKCLVHITNTTIDSF